MTKGDKTEVVPFCVADRDLFAQFLADLPRRAIVDLIRHNEQLRNRYFKGFRITQKLPSLDQVEKAFRQEILKRNNLALQEVLFTVWLTTMNNEVVADASLSLGIASAPQLDAWVADVREAFGNDKDESVRKLVCDLNGKYSSRTILICISILGREVAQSALREIADHELATRTRPDAPPSPERLLELARHDLSHLQGTHMSLKDEHAKETSSLDSEIKATTKTLQERERDAEVVSQDIMGLEQSMNEVNVRLRQRRKELASVTKEVGKLKNDVTKQDGRRKTLHSKQRQSIEQLVEDIHNKQDGIGKLQAEIDAQLQQAARSVIGEVVTQREETVDVQPKAAISETGSSADMKTTLPSQLMGNNAICYEAIQRIFRNTVVNFIRDRLSTLFPEDHIEKMRKPFSKHWERDVSSAFNSRAIGGTETAVRDEYDHLGVSHFFQIFDLFYDKIFSAEAGQPSKHPKPSKVKVLGKLKSIKDSRDPLSHPVEEEIPFHEAHHLIIEAKHVLAWLGLEEESAKLSTLAATLDSGGGVGDLLTVARRLPTEDSIYLEFVGRDAVLKDLSECFGNADSKRFLLAGDGGKGKSAVAFRFAQMLSRSPGRFQLILWLSAKRRRFQGGASVSIDNPDFINRQDAVDKILLEYGATEDDFAKDRKEKEVILRQFLNEFPAFVIADDIDTVLEDDDLVSLFSHEIPNTNSAVLLTSRRTIPGIKTFTIKGFDEKEATQFIKTRKTLYELDSSVIEKPVVRKMIGATDGSPLYLDDLLKLAKIVPVRDAIQIWIDKKGDEARKYALQRELETLRDDAKKVLIAAAVNEEPVSAAELERILRFPQDRLISALSDLQDLFLLPKAQVAEGERRFQLNSNTRRLVRSVEGDSDLYNRIARESKALAGKLPQVGRGTIASLIRQAHIRLQARQEAEAVKLLKDAIERYPNAPDLRGYLGNVYRRIGRIVDAREQFEEAYKRKANNPEMFLRWIKMEIGEGEWSKAVKVGDRALKAVPTLYPMVENRVFSKRQAGFDLSRGLHYEKAEKWWREAVQDIEDHMKPPEALDSGERDINSSLYLSAVICLDMLKDFKERDRWMHRWEAEHPQDPKVAKQKEYLRKKWGGI